MSANPHHRETKSVFERVRPAKRPSLEIDQEESEVRKDSAGSNGTQQKRQRIVNSPEVEVLWSTTRTPTSPNDTNEVRIDNAPHSMRLLETNHVRNQSPRTEDLPSGIPNIEQGETRMHRGIADSPISDLTDLSAGSRKDETHISSTKVREEQITLGGDGHNAIVVEDEQDERGVEANDRQILNWRLRGRYLEFFVVLHGATPEDSNAYWAEGIELARDDWGDATRRFFATRPSELARLKHLAVFEENRLVEGMTYLSSIRGSMVTDEHELVFLVSEMASIGRPQLVKGNRLDYAIWKEPLARYWNGRKLDYDLWQVRDTVNDMYIGGRTVMDISKNVLAYE